ncbi:MAG: hypothetical protein ACOH1T_12370 [Microbacteriaceae bacterium]
MSDTTADAAAAVEQAGADEPINPPLPDQGPRDGTEASDDGPGDQVPGEHDGR